jgi:hypothetical protein
MFSSHPREYEIHLLQQTRLSFPIACNNVDNIRFNNLHQTYIASKIFENELMALSLLFLYYKIQSIIDILFFKLEILGKINCVN